MNLFKPPVIGPFVEPNGLSDGPHTGAAVTWTSNGEAYRLDVTRLSARRLWSDTLGFFQMPDLDLETFLWHCFEHSTRLPEFLNELRPFIRPSGGAPTPAPAGQWLNPGLVEKGFSLGIAKIRGGQTVRVPVVWVFGGNVAGYGARTTYTRVDFIDWTEAGTKLLRRYDCWGTGAQALKRFFHQLADAMKGPLLTDAGEARMRQLLAWAHPKSKPTKKILLSGTDRTLSSSIRRSLHGFPNPITLEFASQVDQLSDKSYVGLLRTCVTRGLQGAACALLQHRPLPNLSRENLLTHFINAQWLEIWKVCGREAQPCLTDSRCSGYNELMSRLVGTGNAALLQAVLVSLSEICPEGARYLVERAFELGRSDLVDVIIASPVIQPVRDDCLLRCFMYNLLNHRCNHAVAFRLLELGVRPIQAIDADDFIVLKKYLLDDENLPVLKHIFELNPPSEESITKLLDYSHVGPGETFDWLCTISRRLHGHKSRMERIAFSCTVSFIHGGSKYDLALLEKTFAEGVALTDIPWSAFENAKLVTDRKWPNYEGNWIDLIAHLIKSGRTEDAAVLKKLRRPSKHSKDATRTG